MTVEPTLGFRETAGCFIHRVSPGATNIQLRWSCGYELIKNINPYLKPTLISHRC